MDQENKNKINNFCQTQKNLIQKLEGVNNYKECLSTGNNTVCPPSHNVLESNNKLCQSKTDKTQICSLDGYVNDSTKMLEALCRKIILAKYYC